MAVIGQDELGVGKGISSVKGLINAKMQEF